MPSRMNKAPNRTRSLAVLAHADTQAIRRETFMGEEHLVVPIIALVEGVLHPSNAPSPELALSSEFARHPLGWNGRPIVLNHPELNGEKVSANLPEIVENEVFGQLFNSRLNDNKLKTEAWINLARVAELSEDVQDSIERLESGDLVEVSTGLFMSLEDSSGTFEGEKYEGIWRNVVPDHLAILPEGIVGACSIEEGCGAPRINSKECENCTCRELNMVTPRNQASLISGEADGHTHTYDSTESGITSEVEEHTHVYNFGDASTGPANGHTHVLPTFAPVASSEANEEDEDGEVEGASGHIKKKPKKKAKGRGNTKQADRTPTGLFRSLLDKYRHLIGFRDNTISDRDTRIALTAALVEIEPDRFTDIIAVMSDNTFIYELFSFEESGLFRRSFKITDSGKIKVGDEKTQVRPETNFIPVNVTRGNTMSMPKEKVDALIANEANKFTKEDHEWLTALTEPQFGKLESLPSMVQDPPKTPAVTTVAPTEPVATTEPTPTTSAAPATPTTPAKVEPATPVTPEAYLAEAPEEIRQVLNSGLKMRRDREAQLVGKLVANTNCPYTEDELKGKGVEELEKLAKLANISSVPNYEGTGVVTNTGQDDSEIPAPPRLVPDTKVA